MHNVGSVKVIASIALFTLEDGELRVVLSPNEDDKDPGLLGLFNENIQGFDDIDLDEVVRRSLERHVGLTDVYAEQLHTFSSLESGGTRSSIVQVSYIALASETRVLPTVERTAHLRTSSIDMLPSLTLNGNTVVAAAAEHLREMGSRSVLPAYLLDREFTMRQLNEAYDAAVGTTGWGMNLRLRPRELLLRT